MTLSPHTLLQPVDLDRLQRGQRRVACDCGAGGCQGWAWARPDLCPSCSIGDHHRHMPVFFASSSWCPCPTCDPLRPAGAPMDLAEFTSTDWTDGPHRIVIDLGPTGQTVTADGRPVASVRWTKEAYTIKSVSPVGVRLNPDLLDRAD